MRFIGRHGRETRFASRVLAVIAVTTAVFIVAQYVSFLVTGLEQAALIDAYFNAVVIECGALMAKRVSEVVTDRIKRREETHTEESEEK